MGPSFKNTALSFIQFYHFSDAVLRHHHWSNLHNKKRQYLWNEKRYFKTKNAILLYFILKGVSNKRKLFLCHIHLNQSFLQHALFCHICNRSLYIISIKYVSALSYHYFCLPFVQVNISAVLFYINKKWEDKTIYLTYPH